MSDLHAEQESDAIRRLGASGAISLEDAERIAREHVERKTNYGTEPARVKQTAMSPTEQLVRARNRARVEQEANDKYHAKLMEEIHADRAHRERDIMPNVRPAKPEDYSRWLLGYLSNGGRLAHYLDHPMSMIYVAVRHFDLRPMCGASSIHLIVPRGVLVTCRPGWSHNQVYYMEGFRVEGPSPVCAYSDTILD